MKSSKISWACSVVIALAIVLLSSASSCNGTQTPLPTVSPTENSPSLPTPTTPPVETVTPTPTYLAPTLIMPTAGATIEGKKETTFLWYWNGTLQEEERFALRVWRLEKSSEYSRVTVLCKCSCVLDTPPDGFGQYLWQVAIIRIDENDSQLILSESQIWPFVWKGAPLSYTPTSTNTPINEPTATHTPTLPPKPTDTDTPTPTPSLIIRPPAMPTLLSAPAWVKPENDNSNWQGVVQLEWTWERELLEDERFSVRIWPEGEAGPGHSKTWAEGTSWQTGDLPHEGWYRCHVVALRMWPGNHQDCDSYEEDKKLCYEEISKKSEERRFYFVPTPPCVNC